MTKPKANQDELTAKQRLAVSREALSLASRQSMWQSLKRLAGQSIFDLLKSSSTEIKKQKKGSGID
jgi:hypothetical protein